LFHRRRHERVKRRFPCEFFTEGQRYRGIVVDVSRGGLFVQTEASTAPGSEIELHLAAAGAVPELVLRGIIVRRRMVPAMLAAALRRGIAVEILEAPREYGLAFGSSLLDAPIGGACEAGTPAAPGGREQTPGWAPPSSSAPAAPGPPVLARPARPSQAVAPAPAPLDPAPEAPRPEVLVVDDGRLDDLVALLDELGADPVRLPPGAMSDSQAHSWPSRLFVTTARLACVLQLPELREEDRVVGIAVAEDESQTLASMMRRLGFQYLVHRPVHPEAMRLLLRKLLYQGADHRRAERHPFGAEVTWRAGWARKRGVLVEISSSGCRLVTDRPLAPGARLRIEIPPEATGGRRLLLRGRILRRDSTASAAPDARHGLAVCFDPLPTRVQQRLDALLARLERGPATLACDAGNTAPEPMAPVPLPEASGVEGSEAATEPFSERRRLVRARLDREVVALDETGTRALYALVGRDLSLAGMRIDPSPDLALGQRLRLALYEPSAQSPIVLEAESVRDDGGAGLALRFVDLAPEVAAQLERIVAALPALESLRPEPQRIVLGGWLDDRSVA
jgi:hypothetical protein